MANISSELQLIQEAEYGEEVRTAIHDAILKINNESGGGGGGDEGVLGMPIGVIERTFYDKATVINPIRGAVHIRTLSDYDGLIPQTVYSALSCVEDQTGISLSSSTVFYVRQGKVYNFDTDLENYYKIYLISGGAVSIESYQDSMYPDVTLFRMRPGSSEPGAMFNPYRAIVPISGGSGAYWYRYENPVTVDDHAFTNCVAIAGGTKQKATPIPCTTLGFNIYTGARDIFCDTTMMSIITK